MDVVVASNNKHKLKEIRSILGDAFDNIYSLSDLGIDCDAEETAETFEGNALIKAKAVVEIAKMPALSDDSGLCVNALNGAPGVHSARYSGEHGNDSKNIDTLLKNLDGATDRTACFVSAVVLCYPDGSYITVRGQSDGRILYEREGTGGFGYDPVFFSNELNKSFGMATEEEKNSVSHRSKALEKLLVELKKRGNIE